MGVGAERPRRQPVLRAGPGEEVLREESDVIAALAQSG